MFYLYYVWRFHRQSLIDSIHYEEKVYKGGVLTHYEHMKSEQQRLDKEIKSLSSKLKHFPEGKLICNRNGARYKWYQSNGHKWTYIPKKNRQLAESLAVKRFLQCQKEYLEQEQGAVECYLKACPKENRAEQLLTEQSEYQNLLAPYFVPKSQALLEWAEEDYDTNPKCPENLTQKVGEGLVVRSKSEAMIAMALRFHKIPFRYECLLEMDGVFYYPDFTILHPDTGKVYYWEHFGMMDDSEYCRKTFSKLHTYASHGIIPSLNLITTYETLEEPLNMEMIETMIKYHFE